MTLYATTIGAKALYLLFVWLASAAGAGWMADRKGYGERLGLTFGLVLSAVGFLIVLLLPARPRSAWKGRRPAASKAALDGGKRGPGSADAVCRSAGGVCGSAARASGCARRASGPDE